MNTDNIDRFGHCVVCHKNLITKRVVDGKVIEMFMPIHDHTDFMLNNGSTMKVCICKPCKETTDLSDPEIQENIMEACLKGWELETEILVADKTLPEWTRDHADEYLQNMATLNIEVHTDTLDKEALVVKSQELSADFRRASIREVRK